MKILKDYRSDRMELE